MKEFTDTFRAYLNALERLREAVTQPDSGLARDASIKRFEFTFELAWKSLQRYLKEQGVVARSPKECLRKAFGLQLVRDHPLWIRMLDDRNLTSHTYDEDTAARIYKNIPDYIALFQELSDSLKKAGTD